MTTIHCLFSTAICWLCVSVTFCQEDPTAWPKEFSPPKEFRTERIVLRPLAPKYAELDFQAAASSREHLQKTLHWGNWPSGDMTVEDNRNDLERHWKEFEAREAYAYTVLTPDAERCVGCVYINPADGNPRAAEMAYWVVANELQNDLDEHLIQSVLGWIKDAWPLDLVVMPLHTENQRGIKIVEALTLQPSGPPKNDMVRYVWEREG